MEEDDNTADFLELLPQLKTLVSTPSTIIQAKAIIGSVPDMCYTLIKIMADLNLLDGEVTTRILAGGNQPPATGPSSAYSTPPASRAAGYQNQMPAPVPTTSVDVRPSLLTPQVSTPPVAPADPTAILAALPPEQRDAVMAIISMTPEQLQAVPPDQRAGLLELRRKFLGSA